MFDASEQTKPLPKLASKMACPQTLPAQRLHANLSSLSISLFIVEQSISKFGSHAATMSQACIEEKNWFGKFNFLIE